jgi:hypothetical protein
MPIEYTISQNGLRIDTFPQGVLDFKETIDYFGRLKNDKRIKPDAIEIVSFKNVSDFQISSSDIEEITRSYQEPRNVQMIKATIFVCETTLGYGIGRMLQTFHEIANPNHNVELVKSEGN